MAAANYNNLNGPYYNLNTSHPITQNSQEYMYYSKFVSIHSEDRDIERYPNAAEFMIELPEDYMNVASVRLVQWTFPANYDTFSETLGNTKLSFRITNPYDPSGNISDLYEERIFEVLYVNQEQLYNIEIEAGFYNPYQVATELTNKFNYVVTERITDYFTQKNEEFPSEGWDATLKQFKEAGGYTRFVIIYSAIKQKLWFGNRADKFKIINETGIVDTYAAQSKCVNRRTSVPDSSVYGLPYYLGLPRCNTESTNEPNRETSASTEILNGITIPRFYFGDVSPGDNGYWLLPLDLSGCQVYWIQCPNKINIMGQAFLYLEVEGLDCIDETQPFNFSEFTTTTNQTNSKVKSSFAKLAVPATPLSQWFDRESTPYKYFMPPAERIRKLKIRVRYHNGTVADFGKFNFSFMLSFSLLVPQILRNQQAVVYPALR
jgi:hypothetical protein